MRKTSVVSTVVASALVLLVGASSIEAADLSGTWGLEFEVDRNSPLYTADCSFKQEGNRLSGSCLSGFESIVPVRGNVQDDNVTFQFSTGLEGGTIVDFSGKLDAKETSMSGTWRFTDPRGNKGGGTFTATKR
jgi:hypothetical protein